MTRLVLVTAIAMAACAHDTHVPGTKTDERAVAGPVGPVSNTVTDGGDQAAPRDITNSADAKAAVGMRVRVRGVLERDKLGDTVNAAGFSVVCLNPRFPMARLDQPVVVEGVLDLSGDFQATREPNGEISQGTEPGTLTYSIGVCTLR